MVLLLAVTGLTAAQEAAPPEQDQPDFVRGAAAFVEPVEVLHEFHGEAAQGQFGWVARNVGDMDEDGVPDLIVGAWQSSGGAVSGGACYLHSGKDGRLLATYTSCQAGDTLGFDAVGLGDVNGDGRRDFLLASAWSGVAGPRSGRVFIVSGPALHP